MKSASFVIASLILSIVLSGGQIKCCQPSARFKAQEVFEEYGH